MSHVKLVTRPTIPQKVSIIVIARMTDDNLWTNGVA